MGEVIDKRGKCCGTCLYFYKPKDVNGHVCSNPESRYVGAWVSDYHKCEDHRYKESEDA